MLKGFLIMFFNYVPEMHRNTKSCENQSKVIPKHYKDFKFLMGFYSIRS